jgi:hypothetical protein
VFVPDKSIWASLIFSNKATTRVEHITMPHVLDKLLFIIANIRLDRGKHSGLVCYFESDEEKRFKTLSAGKPHSSAASKIRENGATTLSITTFKIKTSA